MTRDLNELVYLKMSADLHVHLQVILKSLLRLYSIKKYKMRLQQSREALQTWSLFILYPRKQDKSSNIGLKSLFALRC